jgi:hypothetical protein
MTHTYTVEYRQVVEGTVEVEAESAQDAEDMVASGTVNLDKNGDVSSEDVEVQDTYREDGTEYCETCDNDEDDCVCEHCESCENLVDHCECDEEDEEDEENE